MNNATPPLPEIIAILTRTVSEVERAALGGFSQLSLRQVGYLDAVARLGSPTLSEVARELRVSKPSATVAIEHLAQEGYLEKARSAVDRRTVSLRLTEKGRQLANAHAQVRQFIAGALTESLDDAEKEQLARLLDKIVHAFS